MRTIVYQAEALDRFDSAKVQKRRQNCEELIEDVRDSPPDFDT